MDMKLNKFIHKRLMEVAASIETCWAEEPAKAVTEEEIEDWITEWYMDTFKEINMGDSAGIPRPHPMWLAGPRWYDRRDRKIKEAREIEIKEAEEKVKEAEARSYEKDE